MASWHFFSLAGVKLPALDSSISIPYINKDNSIFIINI